MSGDLDRVEALGPGPGTGGEAGSLARIGGWIPGDPPAYAEQQYEQWARSIEI